MALARTLNLGPGDGQPIDHARGTLQFIGTATVLLRYGGFTLLTDPNFLHKGDHVHLGYGLTSKRVTDPAMELEELPPLDAIILSHLHGDHFDQVVEERLNRNLPIITTPQAARGLNAKGFANTHAVARWETLGISKGAAQARLTAMPARHGPPVLARALPETMGSLIEFVTPTGVTAFRVYISGDTLMYEDLKEIPRRFPDIDLGLFHLGGTMILGLVLVTMDAKQGVEAVRLINPRTAIPIHFDDYTVFRSPLEDFKREVARAGLTGKVHYLDRGDTYAIAVPEARWRAEAVGVPGA